MSSVVGGREKPLLRLGCWKVSRGVMDDPAAELGIEDLDASSGPDLGSVERLIETVSGTPPWDLVSETTVHSFENFEVVDDAPSQSAPDYSCERELDRSWIQLSNKPLQHFWETGFWGRLFGGEDADSLSEALTRPAIVPEPPELVQASVSVMSSPRFSLKRSRAISFLDVVTNTSEQSWQEQRDATWDTAIRRWHSCILTWEGDEPIINIIRSKEDFRSQCQIIVDVLHNKAPSTLLKRCNSISRLVNDLMSHGAFFPCTEDELYQHLCAQRNLGAKPSRLKSLLEAVTFVRHVFNMASLDDCTKSRRCMGVASTKQPLIVKQAPPLLLVHLQAIHKTLESTEDPWEACFCGMILFCTYGRARWGDAQHSQFVTWDTDANNVIRYVECATAIHKTCRALSMRHMFLPLTAPAFGASGLNWAALWKDARDTLDIGNLNKYPLMPAPREDLSPSVRPLTTSEASKWLKLILDSHCTDSDIPAPLPYTSHSFKASCLSYLAKMGCGFSDRLALGYHVDQISMALRYSRDGASRPLRVREGCLQQLRDGTFKPDETRSGRFIDATQTSEAQPSVKLETVDLVSENGKVEGSTKTFQSEPEVVSDSDHVNTSSSSSSSDEGESSHVVMPRVPYRVTLIPEGTVVWRHVKLRTVHLALVDHSRFLSCGRKITDKYKRDSIDVRFDFIKCRQCFSKHAEKQQWPRTRTSDVKKLKGTWSDSVEPCER